MAAYSNSKEMAGVPSAVVHFRTPKSAASQIARGQLYPRGTRHQRSAAMAAFAQS